MVVVGPFFLIAGESETVRVGAGAHETATAGIAVSRIGEIGRAARYNMKDDRRATSPPGEPAAFTWPGLGVAFVTGGVVDAAAFLVFAGGVVCRAARRYRRLVASASVLSSVG